jgi:hypothetical protein
MKERLCVPHSRRVAQLDAVPYIVLVMLLQKGQYGRWFELAKQLDVGVADGRLRNPGGQSRYRSGGGEVQAGG